MKRPENFLAPVIFCFGGSLAAAALADEVPVTAARGTQLSDVLGASGITATGYFAASYYGSNGYPQNLHQFDTRHDSFQLDQAGLTIAFQPKEGFGARLDVIAGEDARLLHLAEDGHDNSIDVKQAFVQYGTGPLTIIAGKFVTLAGAEVISPATNSNFSRSLLFFENEPLTHTGFRATYAMNDTISLIAGVNNGWNSTSTSYGSKTGELGIGWVPNKSFSLTAQGYFGKSELYDAERSLVDIVATYNVTSALTLILNADWDQQKNAFVTGESAVWQGVAGYINYALTGQWRVSVRGEYEDDNDGFLTGTEQHLWEGTVTVGYAPVKSFELRFEGRYDKAGTTPVTFATREALAAGVPDTDHLSQLAIQGVYKF